METLILDYSKHNPTLKEKIKDSFTKPEFKVKHEIVKTLMFKQEYENYELVKPSLELLELDKKEIKIFYPGCGSDMTNLLLVLELLSKKSNKINLILNDILLNSQSLTKAFQKITGINTYRKQELTDKHVKSFFSFKDKKIEVDFFENDILKSIPTKLEKGFDIYFERGFRIMRNTKPTFLPVALQHLNKEGLVMTDAVIEENYAKLLGLERVENIPPQFGLYKEFAVYKKP